MVPDSDGKLAQLQEACDAITREHCQPHVTVIINPRLRATLGKARRHDEVEIAAYVVEADMDEAMGTLRHELAHVFAMRGNDIRRQHGPEWQQWALKLGATPRATSKRGSASHAAYLEYRASKRTYTYVCGQGCEFVRIRRLSLKNVTAGRYVCRTHRRHIQLQGE